jgi:GH24 family phage-related lysozyme (muramidase)
MNSETRKALRDQLKIHEGKRLFVYDDATGEMLRPGYVLKGYPTIGFGRELSRRGITDTEAELLLTGDIMDVIVELDELIPWWSTLDPVRQMAIANMAFNIGSHGLVKNWPDLMRAMKARDWRQAVDEIHGTKYHQQVGRRAGDIMHMIQYGEMP